MLGQLGGSGPRLGAPAQIPAKRQIVTGQFIGVPAYLNGVVTGELTQQIIRGLMTVIAGTLQTIRQEGAGQLLFQLFIQGRLPQMLLQLQRITPRRCQCRRCSSVCAASHNRPAARAR